ncbi:uncharacterized protein LOC108701612 isoform X2 [Xenopus laevis]|uniref:Uncharacterized protein LOC108701612 isoform X2 n=1 Tax=Xenopus laevis TaxID=8355 RepID=A0A8J1LTE2_XENLA|nr:uncharacterized protein LOC108701612 isoform X2 [Xenopus laevis]
MGSFHSREYHQRKSIWVFNLTRLYSAVRSQEKEDYEYQEPEPIEKTTIATEVLNTVTQAPASTVQPVFSKEDIYIITIVALLALIVALSIGWYLHCRYMLVAENFKIERPSDIDIEKGPDTEQPKVAPAEISQKQDPPETSKAISERQKKKDKKKNTDKKDNKDQKKKKKKAQKNKDVCANTTEQK